MKTHDKKVRDTARAITQHVAALASPATNEQVLQVLQVLKDQRCTGAILCAAFWLLDNGTVRFENFENWHPRLRGLRNTPVDGERMFALFS